MTGVSFLATVGVSHSAVSACLVSVSGARFVVALPSPRTLGVYGPLGGRLRCQLTVAVAGAVRAIAAFEEAVYVAGTAGELYRLRLRPDAAQQIGAKRARDSGGLAYDIEQLSSLDDAAARLLCCTSSHVVVASTWGGAVLPAATSTWLDPALLLDQWTTARCVSADDLRPLLDHTAVEPPPARRQAATVLLGTQLGHVCLLDAAAGSCRTLLHTDEPVQLVDVLRCDGAAVGVCVVGSLGSVLLVVRSRLGRLLTLRVELGRAVTTAALLGSGALVYTASDGALLVAALSPTLRALLDGNALLPSALYPRVGDESLHVDSRPLCLGHPLAALLVVDGSLLLLTKRNALYSIRRLDDSDDSDRLLLPAHSSPTTLVAAIDAVAAVSQRFDRHGQLLDQSLCLLAGVDASASLQRCRAVTRLQSADRSLAVSYPGNALRAPPLAWSLQRPVQRLTHWIQLQGCLAVVQHSRFDVVAQIIDAAKQCDVQSGHVVVQLPVPTDHSDDRQRLVTLSARCSPLQLLFASPARYLDVSLTDADGGAVASVRFRSKDDETSILLRSAAPLLLLLLLDGLAARLPGARLALDFPAETRQRLIRLAAQLDVSPSLSALAAARSAIADLFCKTAAT